MISDAKLRALRDALERDGQVTFKNRSKIRLYRDGVEVRRRSRLIRNYGRSDRALRRAYEFAMEGLPSPPLSSRKSQPQGRDFGERPF